MRKILGKPTWQVFGVVAMLAAGSVMAADNSGKDPSRRLQQQLRVAEQEKAKLAQQVATAEAQAKESEAKLAESQRVAEAATVRSARLTKELAVLREQTSSEKSDLTTRLADTERKLAESKQAFAAEKLQMEGAVARLRTGLAGCSERNARMYRLGNELLDKYEAKSCLSSVLQAEPFTGLKRAQIEKMIEEDREKFDKDLLNP
ncbi:hypothetical protein [Dechloromonas sp. HYN0024]|uniref:hypothetical protein n=1 Tax=Dechloromonas sp. HYN0024 TaxID=2231055 RepID=UPI000E451C2D|nr:hypothetical protein [Dechloromonas sp. HYN0024]AXS80127.1 hypothetical protein HYN24_08905 [Dechloromonas sp. HYN0024]